MTQQGPDAEELHTFVEGQPSTGEVAAWLDERIGPTWRGWYAESSGVPGTAMFAQMKRSESGRMVLTGLLLLGDALTADKLRKVPVSALENSVNLSEGSTFNQLRAELGELAPLKRSAEMAPEDFSRLVAAHYNVWARYAPHPAASLAAEWKVKLPTVHTWIREARLRGFLPPAQRGKGRAG